MSISQSSLINTENWPSLRSCVVIHPKPGKKSRSLLSYPGGSGLGNHRPGVASLPGKCLTGCCFQNHWWYYILSGLKRRGSPVGASRQPGEVCWSLQGAACTHIHNIHTDGKYEPTHATTTAHSRQRLRAPTASRMIKNIINTIYGRKMVHALITKHESWTFFLPNINTQMANYSF